jgi:hypothetical protein
LAIASRWVVQMALARMACGFNTAYVPLGRSSTKYLLLIKISRMG